MYRNLLGMGAVFAIALLLVGITFSASKEEPADFRFVNGSEPKSLDPHVVTGQLEGRLVDAIFEGLTYRDPETLRPLPGCAASWDISEDKTTYTFHMRKEARWSDGQPVVAQDFAYAWRRLQEPSVGSEYAYILHVVKWAEVYNLYAGHVKRLVGPADEGETSIVDAVRALKDDAATQAGGGVEAVAWQKFLGQQHVNDAVKGTPDEVLLAAVSERSRKLTPERLEAIAEALTREAARRAEQHAYAKAHFGIDAGVYAKDEGTLVVELNAPTPYFLELTAFYSAHPIRKDVVEQPGDEDDWFLPGKIVANGPFRLEAWRVNDKIRLVRSATYWNKDSIQLRIIDAFPVENYNTALNLYLTGDVDWTPTYPTSIVGTLKGRSDFKSNSGMVVYYYRFNCTKKPFNDPRVRLAVSLAIDRQKIIDGVLKLGQLPASRLVPPGMGAYEPPESKLEPRPALERARALLAEAGYPGGKGMPALGILYNTSETHKTIAEVVAAQLSQNLGMNVKAFNQEWQMYQASTLALDYDMARAGWIGDYLDPNTFLDMWITNGGNNQTGWSSSLYDRLIGFAADVETFLPVADEWLPKFKEEARARALVEAFQSATDAQTRVEAGAALRLHLFRECEAILFQDEFPVMPIYYYVVSSLVQPYVKGWYQNPQDIHPLRGLSIDAAARGAR